MSLWIQRLARGMADQVNGEVAPTMGMDFLTEPLQQGKVVALLQRGVEMWQIFLRRLPELRARQVSQSVGWKVSKSAHRPVNVLQTTLGVVGDLESKEFQEKLIPCGGQVADFEISGDEAGFELEPKKDMKVVGNFIGFDPDEGALHGVGGSPAREGILVFQRGKRLEEIGPPRPPKGVAATDPVFPKAGLGLMDAEGGGLAEGCPDLRFRKALVVQAMPGFMENTIEGDHEVSFLVARGHPRVIGAKAGAERMGAGVEPAGSGIETDFGQKGL